MQEEDLDGATRAAYDVVAVDYARLLADVTTEAPVDRAVLTAFAEMLGQAAGPVLEVGCGSGRVMAYLADAGLPMLGVDLSEHMVAAARRTRPAQPVAVAHAQALPIRAGAVAGVVAWYSLIHLAPARLPSTFAEFARVTRPGAPVVLAFQSGQGERLDRSSAYGHPVRLTSFRHRVEDVAAALAGTGFAPHAEVRREAALSHETTPQAFLLVQRR